MTEDEAYRGTLAGQAEALRRESHGLFSAVCHALGVVRLAAWLARKLA